MRYDAAQAHNLSGAAASTHSSAMSMIATSTPCNINSAANCCQYLRRMARALLLFMTLAAPSFGQVRRVNWYTNAGRVDANVAWVTAHGTALTGLYLCCNAFSFADNGTFSGISSATVRAQTQPLYAIRNMSLMYVIGVSGAAIHSGAWETHVAAAAIATDGFDGFIVDYEPTSNYTVQHAHAYAAFLTALGGALHARGKTLGFDTAGWGILDFWSEYRSTGVDIFTSMTPTYKGNDITESQAFVLKQISDGIPLGHIAAGIGTMLVDGEAPKWNYNWTSARLQTFTTWLSDTAHVSQIDFWRCDIDSYQTTAPYYFAVAEAFLGA